MLSKPLIRSSWVKRRSPTAAAAVTRHIPLGMSFLMGECCCLCYSCYSCYPCYPCYPCCLCCSCCWCCTRATATVIGTNSSLSLCCCYQDPTKWRGEFIPPQPISPWFKCIPCCRVANCQVVMRSKVVPLVVLVSVRKPCPMCCMD